MKTSALNWLLSGFVALSLLSLGSLALANHEDDFSGPDSQGFENQFDQGGRDWRNDRRDDRRSEIDRQQARHLATVLYRGILQRNPDRGGLENNTNLISSRGAQGLMESAQGLADSQEFYQNIMSHNSPRRILEMMYQGLLGRSVDESGRRSWLGLIRSGRAGEAARGIVGSQEFMRRHLY